MNIYYMSKLGILDVKGVALLEYVIRSNYLL